MVITTIEFVPLGLCLLIICTLGLLGNLLSALILQRPRMKSTYSILTLGLTSCDILYLLTKLLRYGLASLFTYFNVAPQYTQVFCPKFGPYLRALTFTAHTGSTYFTIALAVDRYISVCWPVQARFLCTKRRAYFLLICINLFSVFYNIPRWLEFHTNTELISNVTEINYKYSMEVSPLRQNDLYKSLYIFWAYFILLFVIPFSSLTFFNFKIFREVRKSNKLRRKLTPFQQREISFATMLVSIVVMFLICSVDYLVLDLLAYLDIKYNTFWDMLGNLLLSLNSAGNFIIYCIFGKKFRQEVVSWSRQLFNRDSRDLRDTSHLQRSCSDVGKNNLINSRGTDG